jgi:hypothetical protein
MDTGVHGLYVVAVQGAVLGPVLFNILTDSLLHIVKSPTLAFADDLKLIACTSAFTHQDVQNDINTVVNWAELHNMPLSMSCTVVSNR